MNRTTYPHVYRAVSRITAEFAKAGIPKLHANLEDQYLYRSIDDVTARLAPLLAKHSLCILPRVARRQSEECTTTDGETLTSVRLLVRYDLVSSRDGSRHSVQAWGEALDHSDKGTAKAMSSAFKAAMLQTFCIPVPSEDSDASSRRVVRKKLEPEPPQGWSAWSEDIATLIGSCESVDALARLRSGQAGQLASLKRSRPELYAGLGESFTKRTSELAAVALETAAASEASVEMAGA